MSGSLSHLMKSLILAGASVSLGMAVGCSSSNGGGGGASSLSLGSAQVVTGTFGAASLMNLDESRFDLELISTTSVSEWQGDILDCVTFTSPASSGQGTIDGSGSVTLTLDSGGASFGCFLLCGTGDTYCTTNSLTTGTVITPILFNASGDTMATGVAGANTIELGTINMVTSNGTNTGTVLEASVGTLPSSVTAAQQTPAGLACPLGRWILNTGQVQGVCSPGGTGATNDPMSSTLTIAQNTDGSYTASYISMSTQIGDTGECGTQSQTVSGSEVTYSAANSTLSFSFADPCEDLNPQVTVTSGTVAADINGASFSPPTTVACTATTCTDANSISIGTIATVGSNTVFTYTPYGVLMGYLVPCSNTSTSLYYCESGTNYFSGNGNIYTPFTACTGSATANCCITAAGSTQGSCYDANGHLYGATAVAGASNLCASNALAAHTEVATMPINSNCSEMQNSGPASGTNTINGQVAFGQATDTETNCAACIQGNWGGQGGCLGVGTVTCGGASSGGATSIEIWSKQ